MSTNSQKLNDWLQIVGLFSVIGSLNFVGLQLRQTQSIALSETYQNRTATSVNALMGVMSSPAVLSGVSKIYSNQFNELTMPEAVALEYLIESEMTMLENSHLQFQRGFLSEDHWRRNMDELDCMLSVPLFREFATTWYFRDSVKKVISDALQKIPPDAKNCWLSNWNFPMD